MIRSASSHREDDSAHGIFVVLERVPSNANAIDPATESIVDGVEREDCSIVVVDGADCLV